MLSIKNSGYCTSHTLSTYIGPTPSVRDFQYYNVWPVSDNKRRLFCYVNYGRSPSGNLCCPAVLETIDRQGPYRSHVTYLDFVRGEGWRGLAILASPHMSVILICGGLVGNVTR